MTQISAVMPTITIVATSALRLSEIGTGDVLGDTEGEVTRAKYERAPRASKWSLAGALAPDERDSSLAIEKRPARFAGR